MRGGTVLTVLIRGAGMIKSMVLDTFAETDLNNVSLIPEYPGVFRRAIVFEVFLRPPRGVLMF